MLGNTTLNGSSLLSVIASKSALEAVGSNDVPVSVENVTINNDAMMLLAPTGHEAHMVGVKNITMNGGTIAFGHDKGAGYTALLTEQMGGTGGTLIMNGDLAGGNDMLHAGSVSGKGTYNIILNNTDSGKELPYDELNRLIEIDKIQDGSQPNFTLYAGNDSVNPNKGKGTDQGAHKVNVVTRKDPKTGKTVVALITDTSQTSRSA
ncbi:pertactin-like passenger domain-containing protein, partial [Enterobacter asburiae]|uniref:pertactin-like passenger domain-containing protein n=1 Tax=Enterobacter asburiae TaxID=61645 RepID=UPI001E592FB1